MKRVVANWVPLQFTGKPKFERTKKENATLIHESIPALDRKEIHAALEKRMDQQKYLTQHLRALEFIKTYPLIPIHQKLDYVYQRNDWNNKDDWKDKKKVDQQIFHV